MYAEIELTSLIWVQLFVTININKNKPSKACKANHPNGPFKTIQIGRQSGSHSIIQTTEFETEWDVMLTTASLYISTTISCCERRGRYAIEQGHSLSRSSCSLSLKTSRQNSIQRRARCQARSSPSWRENMNVDVRFTRDVLYETSAGLFGGFGLIVQFLRSFSALIVK